MAKTTAAAVKSQKSFFDIMKERRGQRILVIILFMIVPLTLLAVFTYIPFFEMIRFSFYNGVQTAKYSNGTNDIVAAFDACINYKIIPSQYEDFITHVTYKEGEQILIEKRRKEKKLRQEKRQNENIERKKRMGLLNS